jgi:short-subunit dehydrogenase
MPTAVVTGAGGGLGRAIALELAHRGYLVHATDVDAGAAARTAAEIGAGAVDGSLDLWVNNAGVLVTGSSWTQDEATRRAMLEINTLGTMKHARRKQAATRS